MPIIHYFGGIVPMFKYYLFISNFGGAIIVHALGTLIVMTGVRLLITRREASNLGLTLVGMPISFLVVSILEHWGVILAGAPLAS